MIAPWDNTGASRQWVADEERHPWNILALAGMTLPGLATVDVKRGRRIETKQEIQNAAHLTFLAVSPAEVTCHIRMWTNTHLEQLEAILRKIEPDPRERVTVFDNLAGTVNQRRVPRPVTADHPALQLRKIANLYIFDIIGPKPAERGFFDLLIKADEWWQVTTKTGPLYPQPESPDGQRANLDDGPRIPPTRPSATLPPPPLK